jgi:hypothetical protein
MLPTHVPHRLSRQASLGPGTPDDDFAVTAFFHERACDDFAVVATDLKTIRASALLRLVHRRYPVLDTTAIRPLLRFRQ